MYTCMSLAANLNSNLKGKYKMKVGIFQNKDGGVSVVIPSAEALKVATIQQIVAAAVPEGKPFKIVEQYEIPVDRTFRNAWEIDEAELTSGAGAKQNTIGEMLGG